MDIKDEVRGRWPGIFGALGIDVGEGKHKPCPNCGGEDRFRFDDKDGGGTYFCNQCGAGDGWSLVMKCLCADFLGAVKAIEGVVGKTEKSEINNGLQYNPERLRKMYKDSKPLNGRCPGSQYLRNRGLSVFPATLRFLPKCYEPSTQTEMPAILATFISPDSEAITLHRTYLSMSGQKANIDNCKLTMTPKMPMSGGAVRLFPAEKEVGLAEGVETAIAVHELFDIPVWATLSTSLMQSFKPPKGIENIIIYADKDLNYAGERAAYILANRLALDGYAVGVRTPENRGNDFLDEFIMTDGGELDNG